jgi:hypothetical protein
MKNISIIKYCNSDHLYLLKMNSLCFFLIVVIPTSKAGHLFDKWIRENGTSSKHTRYVMDEEHSCNEPEARKGIKYIVYYIVPCQLIQILCYFITVEP